MICVNGIILPLHREVICKSSFIIFPSKITCLSGTSGSGKTTLLYLLGLLDDTTTCEYFFDDKVIDMTSDSDKAYYRKHHIGYVFQESNLLLHLNIKENWQLAAYISGVEIGEEDINNMLLLLELDKTGEEKITELSGGQQQRVAIGMALIKNPRLLLLDEPTSALDSKTEDSLIKLLKKIAVEKKLMIIVASHSKKFIENSDVVYEIKNNEITCIRECEMGVVNKKNVKCRTNFSSLKYVLQYFKKFWKNKILMSLLCSLVIAFFVVSTSITSQIIAKQQELLSEMVNTEIKVGMNFDGPYYEENVESFEKETYDKIIQMDHVEGYLPIVAMGTIILDKEVHVLPYNSYMGLEEFKSGKSIYVSYDLAQLLGKVSYPYFLDVDVGYRENSVKQTFKIEGTLKSSFHNSASKSNYVIYLEETEFYDLFYTFVDKESFIPNTVFVYTDYYAHVNQTKTAIEAIMNGGSVKTEFVDLNSLNESTEKFSSYLRLVSISLCMMLCLMLILIYSRYLINREYEFCILKANGLTIKEVQQIMLNDIVIQAVLFTLCSFGYVMLTIEILKLLEIINKINFFQTLIPILVLPFGTLLIPLIISIKKVNQFSPAKYLRR